jgi:hypothetical protein
LNEKEVSDWVMRCINKFSKFLGILLEGHEWEAMQLFADIEQRWRATVTSQRSGYVKKADGVKGATRGV